MSLSETLHEYDDEKKDPNYVDWQHMENIRVICRFRPINSREIGEEKKGKLVNKAPTISNNGRCVKLHREGARSSGPAMEFYLDKVLESTSSQQSVYLNVGKPMVEACLAGYNSTIFAYGQTGSGKTYTMFGSQKVKSAQELGCVQRSLSLLFAELAARQERKSVTDWKVLLHFVQLYREKVMDLLEPNKGIPLKIRYDPQTDSPYVANLKQFHVTELQQVVKLLSVANRNRVTDRTLMNAESSRSHMIMTLTIQQTLANGTAQKSKLNFADLAGSETYEKALGGRSGKGGIDRKRMEELKTINLSLTNLTTCINYLSKGRKASYRSSQLTFYLMDSLGGNSKTTLIVAASPHIFNRNETIRTLRFAKTAKSVKNKAKVNKELSKAQLMALVKKLHSENKKLKAKLALAATQTIKTKKDNAMKVEAVADADSASFSSCSRQLTNTNVELQLSLQIQLKNRYESRIDNITLSNQELTVKVNELQQQIKHINKCTEGESDKCNNYKANEILSKYFTVSDTKCIDLSDKQLDEIESKIQRLSRNIFNTTFAFEEFAGLNSATPKEGQRNFVFDTQRLTHYLNNAMHTIEKQKTLLALRSQELETQINKKNIVITNLEDAMDILIILLLKIHQKIKQMEIQLQKLTLAKIILLFMILHYRIVSVMHNNCKLNYSHPNPKSCRLHNNLFYIAQNESMKDRICNEETDEDSFGFDDQIAYLSNIEDIDSDGYRYDGFEARWDEWVDIVMKNISHVKSSIPKSCLNNSILNDLVMF